MKTLQKIGATLLGMLLLSTTFTYAGFHEGYQYAPGGATMGFGGHV